MPEINLDWPYARQMSYLFSLSLAPNNKEKQILFCLIFIWGPQPNGVWAYSSLRGHIATDYCKLPFPILPFFPNNWYRKHLDNLVLNYRYKGISVQRPESLVPPFFCVWSLATNFYVDDHMLLEPWATNSLTTLPVIVGEQRLMTSPDESILTFNCTCQPSYFFLMHIFFPLTCHCLHYYGILGI